MILLAVLAGCGGEDPAPPREEPRVAVPDGGMRAGHGDEPRRVTVPRADATAPEAVLRLGPAEAVSGGRAPAPVRLEAPVLEPTAVGRDKQGMTRIRVSLEARLRCGDEVVPLIRYFPPPEIGRPRSRPGGSRRPSARGGSGSRSPARRRAEGAEGTLWADATSAWETEASSAPIRFTYRP